MILDLCKGYLLFILKSTLTLTNKEIANFFKETATLMEIHGENSFKAKNYASTAFRLEQTKEDVANLEYNSLLELGFSKGSADKVLQVVQSGSLPAYDELVHKTPKGVIEMLRIKGLGGKKIAQLWKELDITTVDQLYLECKSGKVAEIKGFGGKTEQKIIQEIEFIRSSSTFLKYNEAELYIEKLLELLESVKKEGDSISVVGDYRRNCEVVDQIEFLIATESKEWYAKTLDEVGDLEHQPVVSGPYTWKGITVENSFPVKVMFSSHQRFVSNQLLLSSSPRHLSLKGEGEKTLYETALEKDFNSEEEIYESLSLPYFIPELREGSIEKELLKKGIPEIVSDDDLKGILHNHSTYSDGMYSLKEMALECKRLGYSYFGIADHSKSAFYANGLNEKRIEEQHQEIDALNKELAPFKVFKGIESDILSNGSLDYEESALKTFDYIVASVHSQLNMDEEKATKRLIKAIENPYTTILGHPTGRLLLRRNGYPIHFEKVIDACARNNVCIEINANPWRLDLDWRWVYLAQEKGVLLSINPDAHSKEGLQDMRYGVKVARKGALEPKNTLNAKTLEEIEKYFTL